MTTQTPNAPALPVVERLRADIAGWEQAYPLSAFPEPDLKRAHAVLTDAGMTLDAISASNMRHVVSRLAPSIHEAADTIIALYEALERLVPPTLCGETWGLPDDETVQITVTFGQLKAARAALARTGEAK